MSVIVIALVGMSPAYAQTLEDKELSIGDRIKFIITDALESVVPELRQQFGQELKESILDDLNNGVSVAQEKIDRVEERLGVDSIREIADVNEINKIYEEFLEIERMSGEEQVIRATALDSKVNQMQIVKQGCERQISTATILQSDNYYETLRTDFCSKTLENIDVKQARGFLGL